MARTARTPVRLGIRGAHNVTNALGAAAALECLGAIMAVRDGVVPPTANFTGPDPECGLDVVPNQARRADVEFALSNSFAFGGLNAVLALRRSGWRGSA